VLLWHWVQQHRVLSVLVLSAVMVACAGGTAWALIFRTVSSPVTLRDALRLYRREQTAKVMASLRNRLPAPGVYTYRTSGGEGLNLMGMERSFPASSSMIVTDGRCATVTWVPILQHTEATTMCRGPTGTLWVARLVTSESIAGSSTTSVVDCPSTAYLEPAGPSPATSWRAQCALSDPVEAVDLGGRTLGRTSTVVGGRSVAVEHVRITLVYVGSQRGTNPTDLWIDPATGLIVRQAETASIDQSGVTYGEAMRASLVSLTPLR
jgi:hypothetical protein